jgi:hypothetical protein
MKKLLIPFFLFALTPLWPGVSQAITQTTSFTLSVTIPEHAGTSANVPVFVSRDEPQTQRSALVQVDEAVRDDQVVLLESYVTK